MSQEKVFLFIFTFLLKIEISPCCFREKNPNPSVWFHLYVAKCCHSGTPKPGHEVDVWIACYWNSKGIATDTGAERERLFMFSSLPNVLTASKAGPLFLFGGCGWQGREMVIRIGKRSSTHIMSIFCLSNLRTYSKSLGYLLLASSCQNEHISRY